VNVLLVHIYNIRKLLCYCYETSINSRNRASNKSSALQAAYKLLSAIQFNSELYRINQFNSDLLNWIELIHFFKPLRILGSGYQMCPKEMPGTLINSANKPSLGGPFRGSLDVAWGLFRGSILTTEPCHLSTVGRLSHLCRGGDRGIKQFNSNNSILYLVRLAQFNSIWSLDLTWLDLFNALGAGDQNLSLN